MMFQPGTSVSKKQLLAFVYVKAPMPAGTSSGFGRFEGWNPESAVDASLQEGPASVTPPSVEVAGASGLTVEASEIIETSTLASDVTMPASSLVPSHPPWGFVCGKVMVLRSISSGSAQTW